MGFFTQENSSLKPAGTQHTDYLGRQVTGTSLDAFLSGASRSPGSYTDPETGRPFTSEYAMREFQWKRAHGQAW
jgi:hypothetical protein